MVFMAVIMGLGLHTFGVWVNINPTPYRPYKKPFNSKPKTLYPTPETLSTLHPQTQASNLGCGAWQSGGLVPWLPGQMGGFCIGALGFRHYGLGFT